MNYAGGKNAVYHQIINRMPPHDMYVEPFLGSGAILRMKRPARESIGLDLDPDAIAQVSAALQSGALQSGGSDTAESNGRGLNSADTARNGGKPSRTGRASSDRPADPIPPHTSIPARGIELRQADALDFLANYRFKSSDLVYCDPPYLLESRNFQRYYKHELSYEQHERLLAILNRLPCKVMISGYASRLYSLKLKDWTSTTYQAPTRSGTAEEWLWMNFPEPDELHDYRYLGADYRERERIKKKRNRWTRKLEGMPRLERQCLLWAIREAF